MTTTPNQTTKAEELAKPVAIVEETCVGPKLFVHGVFVTSELGTMHDERFHKMAAEINARAESVATPAPVVPEVFAQLVDEIDWLIAESQGVAGIHLNGDVASWGELIPGGRFERLSSLNDARAMLAAAPQPPAVSDDKRDPFIRERAQLEQEWVVIQGMKAAYAGLILRPMDKYPDRDLTPEHTKRGVTHDDLANDVESAEITAAYAYVDRVIDVADLTLNGSPAWFGWSIREAFLAGISYGDDKRDAEKEELFCDMCREPTDNPWHYSDATNRHLHACDECWTPMHARDEQIADLRRQVFSYESMVADRDERLASQKIGSDRLLSAIERIRPIPKMILRKQPVRDLGEILAEVDSAIDAMREGGE